MVWLLKVSPVRGGMFIDRATPKTVEPRRGGMIERISRHGDRANTANPIGVKTGFDAAPYGANMVIRAWFYRHAAPTVLDAIGNIGISVVCFSGSEVNYPRFTLT
jgi:hypothetical protein